MYYSRYFHIAAVNCVNCSEVLLKLQCALLGALTFLCPFFCRMGRAITSSSRYCEVKVDNFDSYSV